MLQWVGKKPLDVEAFLFTGRLTDTKKTDFHFEYLGEDRRYHRYFHDFVIVKKTGEFYIIGVKSEKEREDKTVEAKQKAVDILKNLQPDKFRYNIIYISIDTIKINPEQTKPIKDWLNL